MTKKNVIICLSILSALVVVFLGFNMFSSKSELLGNIQLFKKDKENKVVGTVVSSEETLNLKDLDEEIVVADIKEDVVIVDKPVITQKESKKEITKSEIKNTQSIKAETVVTTVKDDKKENKENKETNNKEEVKNEFVKFKRNDKVIATLQAKIFTLVPTQWLVSGGKVVIDSTGIDETTEYVTMDNLSKDLLKNKSGDIKIFAYDEVWNNGTDYVLKTRCYIR